MAGAVSLNPRDYKALSEIATQNQAGQWIAGSKAPGYQKGQFIPTREERLPSGMTREVPAHDVGRSYTMRKRIQLIKANMKKRGMGESEAREFVTERLEDLRDAQAEGDQERISQIRSKLHGS